MKKASFVGITPNVSNIIVISYIDGDGELCVEEYRDDEIEADGRVDDLKALGAKFHVYDLQIG